MKIKIIFKNILLILFLFSIIYDVAITKIKYLSSAKVSFLILLILYLINGNRGKVFLFSSFLKLLIFIFIYSLLLSLYSNDYVQTFRIFYFISYAILSSYFLTFYIKNTSSFLFLFHSAVFIQACILIISFLDINFKTYIISTFNIGYRGSANYIYRAIGLSSYSGAAIALIQGIGFYTFYKLYNMYNNIYKKLFLIISFLIIFISIIITGRTGLFFIILYYIYLLIIGKINFFKSLFLLSLTILSLFIFVEIIINKFIPIFNIGYLYSWILNGFDNVDNKSALNLFDFRYLDNFDLTTFLIGTGRVYSFSGLANASGSDIGYIQTFYALGIIFTTLFYSFLFFTLLKYKNSEHNIDLSFLILILFFVEIKEPFIFKYALPFFIFTLVNINILNKK